MLPRDRIFVRFNGESQSLQSPGALPMPGGGYAGSDATQLADAAKTQTTAWGLAAAYTIALGPKLIDEVRVGASGIDLHSRADDQGIDVAAVTGIPGLGSGGLPEVSPTGFTALGSAGPAPLAVRTANAQVEDTVSGVTGKHAWKAGFQAIRREVDGSATEWTDRGTFIINLRAWEWSGFAQDQIRLFGRLTIQAGLRYSMLPPFTEANDRMVNFNFNQGAPALDEFAGQTGVNRYAGLDFYKRGIAPRVGLALELGAATTLRIGFSKNQDTGAALAEGSLARNPPYASLQDFINGTFQVGPNLSAGLPAPAPVSLLNAALLNSVHGSIYAIQPQNYGPYADQWDVFLERRLRAKLEEEAQLPRLVQTIHGFGYKFARS